MKISVIIPVYNGARTIDGLTEELIKNLEYKELEIILVNDGSVDNSHDVCVRLFRKHKGVIKYLHLAKNFGEHNAVLAGLNTARGDYAVIIDDDFQNPPEEIGKLIDVAVSKAYDVVYGYYGKKYHSLFRNLVSALSNIAANFILDKPRDLYLSSFKCLNRFTIDEVIRYKGPFPYIDGLILRITRNIGKVLVRHAERKEGRSGYTVKKLIRLWLNMFVNFSVYPLRLSAFLGFVFSIIGAALSVYLIIDKIIHPGIPMGVTSILIGILVFSGIQLIMLGVIGEYLGKEFLTNNQTPQYIVRQQFIEDVR